MARSVVVDASCALVALWHLLWVLWDTVLLVTQCAVSRLQVIVAEASNQYSVLC
jgi:hypothetical protein